jgi:16S rRNA (uracil1498-N3)-methyltransferase
MKEHRFIGDFDIRSGSCTVLDKEILHQFKHVLRLQKGDVVIISDGQGSDARTRVRSITKDEAVLDIEDVFPNGKDPECDTTLYCAILKRENFELVAQKATEAGISRIVPVITARTVKQRIRSERLTKIIREASEQCGRSSLVQLEDPKDLADALDEASGYDHAFIFDERSDRSIFLTPCSGNTRALYIGPEGGWTEAEVISAIEHGCTPLHLGSRTLRAETAAIVGSYIIVNTDR